MDVLEPPAALVLLRTLSVRESSHSFCLFRETVVAVTFDQRLHVSMLDQRMQNPPTHSGSLPETPFAPLPLTCPPIPHHPNHSPRCYRHRVERWVAIELARVTTGRHT